MKLLPEAGRMAWLLVIATLTATASLEAQDKAVVLKGARIETAVAPAIPNGVLVVQNGKIAAVGATGSVAIPADADVRDVSGMVIIPGVVDTHSHIGGIVNESSGPAQPDLRVLDAIDPRNGGFRRALAGGITTVNIMPGSGNVIGGQTIYLKLRRSVDIGDLFIRDADGKPTGGLKMANGTNPIGAAPYPTTRAKTAAIARAEFIKAREYAEKIAKAGDDPSKLPPRDLALETLAEVLAGKRVVHHHTHRQDDILTVLRLKEEFGFKLVLQHVTEARFVAEQIAKAGVPCSLINVDSPGGKLEVREVDWTTARVLEDAGVLVAFHTDDPVIDSRFLIRSAALAIRAGLDRDAALRALTINPARILDLDSRIGSLEPGKDADFVLLDGDPFSTYTHVQETWVEGKRVFDFSNPEDHLYAVGGEGAGSRGPVQLCCFGELHEGGAQ